MRVAVLMTCFNRKKMTLEALDSLFGQTQVDDLEMTVFLVDDGSRDGTSLAVAKHFPLVRVLPGDGSLFWNGGMRRAFAHALVEGFDGYIWFNDDTGLESDAISRLLTCYDSVSERLGPSIIVGSIRDPHTGRHSYGGVRKKVSRLRMDFVPQLPDDVKSIRCDTMNGNFTFIPASAANQLGNLESGFRHQLGDFDYGLRATKAGISVVIAPGYFGYCSDNSSYGTWRDISQPFTKRWKHLLSPKGAPPREWLLYTSRHFGWRWPIYAISPYLKVIVGKRIVSAG